MPKCANCPKKGRLKGRGLCNSCHANIAVRYKFADLRAKPERPRCATAECPNAAKKGRRGLCKKCFENPTLREAQADRRLKPLSADHSRRNEILENPDLCQPAHLGQYAKMVRRKFRNNPRIDWQDLIQVGWLALIRAAERWTPEKSKTLTAFAGKTAMREMAHAARRELRSVTAGDTKGVDSGRQFVPSAWRRDKEDADIYRSLVRVTDHALKQYLARINPKGTAESVRQAVAKSKPAPPWMADVAFLGGGTAEAGRRRGEGDLYLVYEGGVYIVGIENELPVVYTVMTVRMFEDDAAELSVLTT